MGRIRVGKADVKPDTPTHVRGMREGNKGPHRRQAGHHEDGTSDARRATGIHPKKHDAVAETMPNLPPG
ncbi:MULTISPECIES: hypothetical protein [Streptomyces]|uniref:Uncharacterized protein n=1 Tax=Streptomyces morookaense TaxID=1970 RepID=A0A7Y7B0L7_STRMO|nr:MULTISPECIES: hypothetical protein [Streptomyces]MCC2274489.1 hypothetical protein [Streptomyces sp. ET3-23]NVK76436.1 hypothetical protein [Streptomyces morookaense]GHF07064.1 hypothetical protein GCM10010359_05190 [Streptomyces morookaense]